MHIMWMLQLVLIAVFCGQGTLAQNGCHCPDCHCPCDCSYPECPDIGSTCNVPDPNSDIDECDPSPCQNGGSCEDENFGYKCFCAGGYTGVDCEENIDDCASNECQHGSCVDGVYAYSCACDPGYEGRYCENEINECRYNPCQHGICSDGMNSYSCTCDAGYAGDNCDIDIDECASNPCNQGTCEDEVNYYKCYCDSGFSGEGCDSDMNSCETNPCQNGGMCEDEVNGYKCECMHGYVGKNCENVIHIDCQSIMQANPNAVSGIFDIYPGRDHHHPLRVYCQFDEHTGGSIVFQRRQDGSENFKRSWQDYEHGFGDMHGEFWLGNRALHRLTDEQDYHLRVDLVAEDGDVAYANYDRFSISGSVDKYRMYLTGYSYSSTAGDSFIYHNHMQFSTYDSDNDDCSGRCNCAKWNEGGWWYKDCEDSNLNGHYQPGRSHWSSICWWHFKGNHNLKATEMRLWRLPGDHLHSHSSEDY